MILLMTNELAKKKRFKKLYKVAISLNIQEEIDKHTTIIQSLVPSPDIFKYFIDGKNKKYAKEYISSIRENDELFATLLAIVLAYKQHGKIAFVCDPEEYTYGYLFILADYLNNRYGINYLDLKKSKKIEDIEDIKMSNINFDKIKKDVNKYSDILLGVNAEEAFEEYEYGESKKDKKKKKHKKDKKKNKNKEKDIEKLRKIVIRKIN